VPRSQRSVMLPHQSQAQDTPSRPPMIVYLARESLVVIYGKCWSGHFHVFSSKERPVRSGEMRAPMIACLDHDDERRAESRFFAFTDLVERTFDIRMQHGKLQLLDSKGRRLATLRPLTAAETKEYCAD
jgi:hypothetical protein